ncbi:RNA ligase 1 family protein [Streptomyces cylindrosporus]|uniref:DUF5565 family protein n=1 Tax=Streptomyces cylindrosporus TaxID=2927583 RepID=A0ABS9YM14_9ACTN|nr:DUF5565 family protein [Streptomyces cylindrosporus]MCI3277586.1 DUF5565 family protein [Streptomyces cylindrosporus]
MRKIPTLFVRDPEDRRRVLPTVTPGCEWVLAGQGRPTRKLDGTCVMYDEHGAWWARREVKPGKTIPPGFVTVQHDENTSKLVGWEPIVQSSFAKYHAEALDAAETTHNAAEPWIVGTYELIGPNINGNPERYDRHWLVAHTYTETLRVDELTFDGIRDSVLRWHRIGHIEGIVWHHPDGRMVKIKARDFTDPEPLPPSPTDELHTAAVRMRTLNGPAAEPIAKLLETTADHIDFGSGAPGHPLIDAAIAVAQAINGGQKR